MNALVSIGYMDFMMNVIICVVSFIGDMVCFHFCLLSPSILNIYR